MNRSLPSPAPLAALGVALALYASGCCGACQDNPDAQLPDSVPVYPKADNLNRSQLLGVTLAVFEAPDDAKEVKSYYDKQLKKRWEPVEGKWTVRRKLSDSTFQYRRFKEKDGEAYLMIDVADVPGAPYTHTELHYCPDGPTRCKPKS